MKITLWMFCIVNIFYITSCVKCDTNPGFYLDYENFDSTEKSQIILETFTKGEDFKTLTGVYMLDTMNKVSNDTTYEQYFRITSDQDYIVNLPLANRSFKIRDIKYNQITGGYPGSDWTCENAASWYVNDVYQSYRGIEPIKHGTSQSAIIELKK